VYAATKDGLAAFARSLRVANYNNQKVLTVFPGPTRTAHAARYSPDNERAGRRMPPARLADEIYTAVHAHHSRLIPGPANKAAALAGRLAPGLMMRLMRRAIFDPLGERVLL
jgi:short-subunit dehydrogenase